MMNLRQAIERKEFAITAEVAPPKGKDISEVLEASKMLAPYVHGINITDNQSSVMRLSSLGYAIRLKREGINGIYQLTCRDRNRIALQGDLLAAASFGVDTLLALTGDHPKMGDHPQAKPVYDVDVIGLLEIIKILNGGKDMSGANLEGGPTNFFVGASVTPSPSTMDAQLFKLERKIKAGAKFIQTQGVFDVEKFREFMNRAKDFGVPIMAGIILLKNAGMAKFMNANVPGVFVQESMIKELEGTEKKKARKKAVEIAVRIIGEIKEIVQGVHLMPLGWDDEAVAVLEKAKLKVNEMPPDPKVRVPFRAKILDGDTRASEIRKEVKQELEKLREKGKNPHLVAVQVGENAASRVYVRSQEKACEAFGIPYTLHEMPGESTEADVIAAVDKLSADPEYTGIIVQMPLPPQVNARKVREHIAPTKDVEAITATNMGKLVMGDFTLAPCTAAAAMEVFKLTGESLKGKEIVVVGHSEIVGKPLSLMMLGHPTDSATPTVCHIATRDLRSHLLIADVVFVAVGKAGLVRGTDLKKGAIVIDIGINRIPMLDDGGYPVLDKKGNPKSRTVGDVDYETAKDVAAWISPVPGGVGPITVTMLLRNTVRTATMQV
jgi:5,10-methylene-tetrahydrofolate dehydrogenase/methenyl tetrahydrofolate cyclohydrolase/5,10-methylenetetrahydrofolate reductase